MQIKRVLTIESVDDFTTRRMLKSIYGSAEFKDYIIDHFYFLGIDKTSIDKKELFDNLDKKITEFNPDAILIHTGGYFLKNKDSFLYTIPKLKSMYTHILIGIERRDIIDDEMIKVLDDNEELKELENKFFRIKRF